MRYAAKADRCPVSGNGVNSEERPAPIRQPRFGGGSEIAMKNHAVEVRDLSALVGTAFDELATQSGTVVEDFRQAFQIRSQFPELPEWGGHLKGLIRTLGQLLRRVPPESYLKKKYTGSVDPDAEFRTCFKKAIAELASRDPEALEWFEQHVRKGKISRVQALRALLARYAADREVFPY